MQMKPDEAVGFMPAQKKELIFLIKALLSMKYLIVMVLLIMVGGIGLLV